MSTDPEFPCTVDMMSKEELIASIEPGVMDRYGKTLDSSHQRFDMFARSAEKALFKDCGSDSIRYGIDVVAFWCDRSPSICQFTANYLQKRFQACSNAGILTSRKARVVKMEDANHFVRSTYLPSSLRMYLIIHSRSIGTIRKSSSLSC